MRGFPKIDERAENERNRDHVPALRNETALENGYGQPTDEHPRTLP
jgi:hypothetical protein